MVYEYSQEEGARPFFLDQLCAIGICGALGIVMILLVRSGELSSILVPAFHSPVLWGGIALVLLVLFRVLAVGISAFRRFPECDPVCDHENGKSRKGASWRYVVLLLPIALYFLNMPAPPAQAEEKVQVFALREIEKLALVPEWSSEWSGKTIRLRGQYSPGSDDTSFGLFRRTTTLHRASCKVSVSMASNEKLEISYGDWVEVTGILRFQSGGRRLEYVPILEVRRVMNGETQALDIKKIPAEPDLFED